MRLKLRLAVSAVLVLALALPVVAGSSVFTDVNDKHATAVDYVAGNRMLPPDSRAQEGKYGARYLVSDTDIVNAIRNFERMEGDRLRREEFASFLLAGVQKVRDLKNPPTTTTTTEPATTTTTRVTSGSISSRTDTVRTVHIPAGVYKFTSSTSNWGDITIKTLDGSSLDGSSWGFSSERLADSWGDPDNDVRSLRLKGGTYLIEISRNGTVRWERIGSRS